MESFTKCLRNPLRNAGGIFPAMLPGMFPGMLPGMFPGMLPGMFYEIYLATYLSLSLYIGYPILN